MPAMYLLLELMLTLTLSINTFGGLRDFEEVEDSDLLCFLGLLLLDELPEHTPQVPPEPQCPHREQLVQAEQ